MPTDADRDAATAETQTETTETAAAPVAEQPKFGLDDLKVFAQEIVRGFVPPQSQPQPQQVQIEPMPEEPTDEEWRENPRAAGEKALARALHPIRQQMAFGLERISEMAPSSFASELPYYNDYRNEIEAERAKLPPAVAARKDTLRLIHDTVAMRHEGERREAARQEGIRQGRGNAPTPSGVRADPNAPKIPTPSELGLDQGQIDEITAMGGPDAFARTVSGGRFGGWKDWVAAREKMNAAPKGRGARGAAWVMPFARLEPKKHAANG